MDAQATLQDLLKLAPRDPTGDEEVVMSGQDPVLPTNYLLGTAGAAVIAAVGVAAPDLWYLRTGRRQQVTVDMRAAAWRSDLKHPPTGRGRRLPMRSPSQSGRPEECV